MAEITFGCPKCGQLLQVGEEMVGQEVVCPSCSNQFPVQASAPTAPAPAAPQPQAAPETQPTPATEQPAPEPTPSEPPAEAAPEPTATPAPEPETAPAVEEPKAESAPADEAPAEAKPEAQASPAPEKKVPASGVGKRMVRKTSTGANLKRRVPQKGAAGSTAASKTAPKPEADATAPAASEEPAKKGGKMGKILFILILLIAIAEGVVIGMCFKEVKAKLMPAKEATDQGSGEELTEAMIEARDVSRRTDCQMQLRLIQDAKTEAWSEGRVTELTDCDEAANRAIINEYIDGNTTPTCPSGGVYTYKTPAETDRPKCNVPTHEYLEL